MKFDSFKTAIEQVVRQGFENQMMSAITSIEAKAINDIKAQFDEARKDAKNQANKLAIEFIQKANVSGFSLELKI